VGRAAARADVSGDKEADPEGLAALIKALTGREPGVCRRSDGRIEVVCYREHLECFMCCIGLAGAVARWLGGRSFLEAVVWRLCFVVCCLEY
jgi:hypothetical protein